MFSTTGLLCRSRMLQKCNAYKIEVHICINQKESTHSNGTRNILVIVIQLLLILKHLYRICWLYKLHTLPSNPTLHIQVYPPTSSTHVALLRHGELLHSFMLFSHWLPVNVQTGLVIDEDVVCLFTRRILLAFTQTIIASVMPVL